MFQSKAFYLANTQFFFFGEFKDSSVIETVFQQRNGYLFENKRGQSFGVLLQVYIVLAFALLYLDKPIGKWHDSTQFLSELSVFGYWQ